MKQYRHDKHLIKPTESRIETKKEKEEKEENGEEKKTAAIKLILKTDNLGSLEAVMESLKKYKHEEVNLEIVYSGLGNISESDVLKAEATGAILRGFNVSASKAAEDIAREKNLEFKSYKVIYELLEEIKLKMEELLDPEIIEEKVGRLKVIAIFRTEKKSMIIGGQVTDGKLLPDLKAKIIRSKEEIGRGKISQLQIEKNIVKEVKSGQECGLKFEGKVKVEENDIVEIFTEKKIYKKIES